MKRRTLSGVRITDFESLQLAISTLHSKFSIPHVLITSIQLNYTEQTHLSIAGSTMTSSRAPRIFTIKVPRIDNFFSGTGDMFAALILVRLKEMVSNLPELACLPHWSSEDFVQSVDLPLAKATESVLGGIHEVLSVSKRSYDKDMEAYRKSVAETNLQAHDELKLAKVKAAEVRIVRNIPCLKNPKVKFKAVKL